MNLLAPLVLIVDIENLKPPLELEGAISNAFGGISLMKIAVGNWKLLSCDRELKARGYHLFHIPQGQDAADIEICELANLLGNGTKIVIVSNDNFFIDLAVRSGEIEDKCIYIIRKHRNKYYLSEWMYLLEEQIILTYPVEVESQLSKFTKDRELVITPDIQLDITPASTTISAERSGKFTSDRELANALKNLVQEYHITVPENLGSKFKDRYGIGVKEAIKSLNINQIFTVFLSSHGVMTIEANPRTLTKTPSATSQKSELLDKLRKLIVQNPSIQGDICKLCHRWKALYKFSLSTSMQQAGIPGKPGSLVAQVQSKSNFELN